MLITRLTEAIQGGGSDNKGDPLWAYLASCAHSPPWFGRWLGLLSLLAFWAGALLGQDREDSAGNLSGLRPAARGCK